MHRMMEAQLCFRFLAPEVWHNQLQTLQVCTAMLQSGAVPVSLLSSLEIGSKVRVTCAVQQCGLQSARLVACAFALPHREALLGLDRWL